MEDLLAVLRPVDELSANLEKLSKQHFLELDELFYGTTPAADATTANTLPVKTGNSITPQQTKKKPKRLSALAEDDGDENAPISEIVASAEPPARQSVRVSNAQLLAVAEEVQDQEPLNSTGSLMPPPPAPVDSTLNSTATSGRPQRAAKLRSESKLKEQPLNSKLRRPTSEEIIKVKLEHEQRFSQLADKAEKVPEEQTAVVEEPAVPEEVAAAPVEEVNVTKSLRVKVKREKLSIEPPSEPEVPAPAADPAFKAPAAKPKAKTAAAAPSEDETLLSTTNSISNITANTTANSTASKKTRKKNVGHRPIKVERFSLLDKSSPISSRTRKGSTGKRDSQEPEAPPAESQQRATLYEDAIDNQTRSETPAAGTTMVLGPGDATFNMPLANATMTLSKQNVGDATFQVDVDSNSFSSNKTMETARDCSLPQAQRQDSLLTDDEDEVAPTPTPLTKSKSQLPAPTSTSSLSGKAMKMPSRTHELFNPLMQSPVKMRVEAFENAARSKRLKDQTTPGSSTTPVIGKLPAPTLGRFLTPTQSSSMAMVNSAQPKKAPLSACKATSLVKTATGTNLKSTNSTSTKTLSRENSGDDFRKGLHQLAEERKKQREAKHLQAAQQREAKEKERADRMAKLAKEREEKRLKKQQEQERKRLEMEELQRKLRQQEEAEAAKKAKAKAVQDQEREMLQQMKKQQQLSAGKGKNMMLPPPPKSKYTFEMLHEDDSTDDEGKVSYKRPPAPTWSRSHVRGAAISLQTHCPTDVIDSFFSVAPVTPDLKLIFPEIDPRQLKRNSSVLWSTPPRYSELPKY